MTQYSEMSFSLWECMSVCEKRESMWLYKILNNNLGKKCSLQFGQWPKAICISLCEFLWRMLGPPLPPAPSSCSQCTGCGHGLNLTCRELSLPMQGQIKGVICRKRYITLGVESLGLLQSLFFPCDGQGKSGSDKILFVVVVHFLKRRYQWNTFLSCFIFFLILL